MFAKEITTPERLQASCTCNASAANCFQVRGMLFDMVGILSFENQFESYSDSRWFGCPQSVKRSRLLRPYPNMSTNAGRTVNSPDSPDSVMKTPQSPPVAVRLRQSTDTTRPQRPVCTHLAKRPMFRRCPLSKVVYDFFIVGVPFRPGQVATATLAFAFRV